jgi:clan AA aspartic protease
MGYVHTTIELSNPRLPELAPVQVGAMADTGALMLCIPEALARTLQLTQESEREVTVADGRSLRVPYVGPVKVACQGRICFVGALVLGDDVLLGAVPMEDMDLTINPSRQRVEPDPRSPDIPHALVKGLTHGCPPP